MGELFLVNQLRRQVVRDIAERGETSLHRRGFADPVEPVLAPHPDKGAALLRLVLRRPGDLKGFDLGDFHARSNSFTKPPCRGLSRPSTSSWRRSGQQRRGWPAQGRP